ncbi:MAG: DUF2075 domain-containing protein [Candidatus Dojkabacteria bacterium]|nr:MAG: DUF2075 domain-containing protein [Candidatus Dojkabacteria bacterium]
MYEIKKFNYRKDQFTNVRDYRYGENWPIVYILEDGKEAYIGETTAAYRRASQHFEKADRAKLNSMYIIADDEYNKSATLDIESSLIRYMSGDGKYLLQNANFGIQESNYYDRERYQAKFETIWKELQKLKVVDNDLVQIQNSDLFKYSPYKALSQDQLDVVDKIMSSIKFGERIPHLVSGEPGTGKTIVATYLVKALSMKKWSKDLEIGLVIPMTSLRKTLKRVFRNIKGLTPGMVIGPNDVVRKKYDILIVDEAHRLQRRVNLTNYRDFDKISASLGLEKDSATQLDWILQSSKHQVLFYDKYQSVKPADIKYNALDNISFVNHKLTSQMRVNGGMDYIEYIRDILNCSNPYPNKFYTYEFKLFNNIKDMVLAIKEKDYDYSLSRILAGYAWEWKTKGNNEIDYDIEIDGTRLKWNSVTEDWVNSPNAVNEIGCIHTIQGYDLNYAGVIIGPEISYDKNKHKVVVDKSKYLDFNGKRAISDPAELEAYIKNIYTTLLTRGINGTYVYIVDDSLRQYMSQYFL